MIKALLYKEWIKTRWPIAVLVFLAMVIEVYMFVRLGRSVRIAGHEHLWDVIINRDQFMFYDLKYFPLFAGLTLGLFQFFPEMNQKRLKLTLHLPMKEFSIISWMTAYGLITLLVLFILQGLALLGGMAVYFPGEFIISAFYTTLPWFVAGILAYLACVLVNCEPTWKRRISNVLLTAGTIRLLFLSDLPGAYSQVFILIPVLIVLLGVVVYLSVYRFKSGLQD